jgi:glycine/D-amino acid oxidase-like deaminating enzyme/nitrite reductase/ring-hydroxylating ferredoxin subunit
LLPLFAPELALAGSVPRFMDTKSYWIDSAKGSDFPSLAESHEVDVIVIGGGITGVTAAYLAKQAGKRVALVERNRIGSIDTGHTTAHLTAVTDSRLYELKSDFNRDVARAVWDAGEAAIDQIVKLIRREKIDCEFQWVPGYLHAPLRELDPQKIDELQKEAGAAADLDISNEFLDAVPSLKVPGIKFPHQALFHPLKYINALAAKIPGDGSYVFENTSADEVESEPLSVKSGRHRIRGNYLIVASHNPLQGLSGTVSAMLFQTKLALYSTYVVGAKIPKDALPIASFWDTADPYDYVRITPYSDYDYVIYGGEDHKTGQLEDTQEPYRRLAQRLLAIAPQAQIDHRWSGQVIETNDGLPYIGETAPRQFAGTGFAGNGMTFGTLSAMMAVDALLGRKNPWADLFDIHRKKLLGGTWEYLKENVDYPYYLLRNFLAKVEGESVTDVKNGEGKILKLDGQRVAASRDEKGNLSLCSAICTHMRCIVEWNNAEKTWDCPCHGSRFNRKGEVISGPAEEPLEPVKG